MMNYYCSILDEQIYIIVWKFNAFDKDDKDTIHDEEDGKSEVWHPRYAIDI